LLSRSCALAALTPRPHPSPALAPLALPSSSLPVLQSWRAISEREKYWKRLLVADFGIDAAEVRGVSASKRGAVPSAAAAAPAASATQAGDRAASAKASSAKAMYKQLALCRRDLLHGTAIRHTAQQFMSTPLPAAAALQFGMIARGGAGAGGGPRGPAAGLLPPMLPGFGRAPVRAR
jgi:hypothetical protein